MTLRFQRLVLILITLVILCTSVLLILFNTKKNIVFFYTATELIEKNNLTTTVFPINTNFFDFGDKADYLKNRNKKKLF